MEQSSHPPMINLPPATKILLLVLVAVQVVMQFLPMEMQHWVLVNLSFVPARYSGDMAFGWQGLVGPFSSLFLHGGWFHLGINCLMLTAFGAGLEKMTSSKVMIGLFLGCGLLGCGFHYLVAQSPAEFLIGASGGISGLFGALIFIMNQFGGMQKSGKSLVIFAAIWIAILVGTGILMSDPNGMSIGWAAHVGGFLGGLLFIKPVLIWRAKNRN